MGEIENTTSGVATVPAGLVKDKQPTSYVVLRRTSALDAGETYEVVGQAVGLRKGEAANAFLEDQTDGYYRLVPLTNWKGLIARETEQVTQTQIRIEDD